MKRTIILLASIAWTAPASAERWTLIDFGADEASCVMPYPGWTNLLRHPTRTQFVDPDGNPDHAGITITTGLSDEEQSYFGIAGATPIHFRPGHEIICTLYNRADFGPLPTLRISFNDANEPDPADASHPWYTAYNSSIHINTEWVPPFSLVEMRYYIQDEGMLAAIDGVVSSGLHSILNANFAYNTGPDEPPLILTKIEFSDEADLTPPTQPAGLRAALASLTPGASSNVVRLSWHPSTDPGDHATGISRYYIYRDAQLYDVLTEEMTAYLGTNLCYYDLSAAPGTCYTYAVAAIDKAQYGLYPRLGRPPCHPANQSPLTDPLVVTTPVWSSTTLLNPWTDFVYAGGLCLPLTADYDWSYASGGLTWYPDGNPAYDPTTELPGALYALSRTQYGVGAFNIPKPVLSTNLADWSRATALIPVNTNIWPLIYGGNPVPAGGGEFGIGDIVYHPGGNGITGRLYYSIANYYDTDATAPSHGWFDLDLAAGHGAWHIGGYPPTNICPSLTTRYSCRIPQAWADAHTGGRSLLIGNNFMSGGPENFNGPNMYAVAPWESGTLPANGGVVPATRMLQYSPIGAISNRVLNWRIDRNAEGAVWLEAGGRTALALSYRRPMGDNWYGDSAGNNYTFYNIPAPPSMGEGAGASRWRHELMLYNPADLADVVHGAKEPWEPQPYLSYDISRFSFVTNVADPEAGAICYSDASGYFFFMEPNGEVNEMHGENGLIHAWKVKALFQPALQLSILDGNVIAQWQTANDASTQHLQSASAAADGCLWTNISGGLPGDGAPKSITNALHVDDTMRFYRVEVAP